MSKEMEHVKSILEKYSHLDITNPERFATLKTLTVDQDVRLLAKIATSGLRPLKDELYKIHFIYTHYQFIKNHLKALICKYEGGGASTDKTRLLIQAYLDFLQTGETPDFSERNWKMPRIGSGEEWMNWIDSMCEMYHGDETSFIQSKQILFQQYEHWLKTSIAQYDQFYRNNEYFLNMEIKDGKRAYHFLNEQTEEKGSIFLGTPMEISYSFKTKPIPDWFENLLNIKCK